MAKIELNITTQEATVQHTEKVDPRIIMVRRDPTDSFWVMQARHHAWVGTDGDGILTWHFNVKRDGIRHLNGLLKEVDKEQEAKLIQLGLDGVAA